MPWPATLSQSSPRRARDDHSRKGSRLPSAHDHLSCESHCSVARRRDVRGDRGVQIGDLISCQNGGKGWLVIPDEIEQTVSEYASQRIDIRAGNALISVM